MKNMKILVAGLGNTGLSVLAYCRYIGADAAAYDAISPNLAMVEKLQYEFPDYPIFSGDLAQALQDRDVLVLSPGISRRHAAIVEFERRGGMVTGDVAILSDLLRGQKDKIIAITGSNGKTTVTELVGHLCRSCGCDTVVAGNIGTPVLQAWLERSGQSADVWVLELSSFQLETTPQLEATAAVCLNVSEDHLDRYDDLLDYARTKDMIFNGCKAQVLNEDDVLCRAMKRDDGRVVKYFSLNKSSHYYFDGGVLNSNGVVLLEQSALRLQGRHNIANVLAALALCELAGMDRTALLKAVQTFEGLPHRVEKIGEKNGVVFIDDSKGTNVGATCAAVMGLSQPIVLIAGGMGKGQDFTPLRDAVIGKVRAVMLIGQDAAKIATDLNGCGIPLYFCDTLSDAVVQAYTVAQSGDVVLLSPACASFDMFKGYAHRAEVFIQAFNAL